MMKTIRSVIAFLEWSGGQEETDLEGHEGTS